MITADFLSDLDRFSMIVKKRVTSKYSGVRASNAVGRGITLKDYRIYSPGDDFRLIDWRIYGRTDDLYIKQYEEERNLVVHVIVDASASMAYGKKMSKFSYAAMLGVGFAYLALKDNEHFQFSTFSDTLQVFRPEKGMSAIASMLEYLNKIKPAGKSNIQDTLFKYRRLLDSKSMVIIISDFLYDLDELRESLHMLKKSDIKLIQVLDPAERDLVLDGDVKLTDAEEKSQLRTYVSERLKQDYKSRLREHNIQIEKTATALQATFYSLSSGTPIFDAFYQVLR